VLRGRKGKKIGGRITSLLLSKKGVYSTTTTLKKKERERKGGERTRTDPDEGGTQTAGGFLPHEEGEGDLSSISFSIMLTSTLPSLSPTRENRRRLRRRQKKGGTTHEPILPQGNNHLLLYKRIHLREQDVCLLISMPKRKSGKWGIKDVLYDLRQGEDDLVLKSSREILRSFSIRRRSRRRRTATTSELEEKKKRRNRLMQGGSTLPLRLSRVGLFLQLVETMAQKSKRKKENYRPVAVWKKKTSALALQEKGRTCAYAMRKRTLYLRPVAKEHGYRSTRKEKVRYLRKEVRGYNLCSSRERRKKGKERGKPGIEGRKVARGRSDSSSTLLTSRGKKLCGIRVPLLQRREKERKSSI